MSLEERETTALLAELGAAVTLHVSDHPKRRHLLEVIAELRRRAQRGTELVRIAARMEAAIDACWLRCDVCGLIERGCAASKPLPCYGRGAGTVGHQPCAGVFREIGRRIGP